MSGASFWHAVWEKQGTEGKERASGRTNYGPSQAIALAEDAVRGLVLEPWDSLLDVGCAAGLMGEILSTKVSRYVGVDYSAASIAAFKAARPKLDLRVADATDLSQFKDGEFTKTLMSSVLLCLDEREALLAMKEMRRVTRDRGRGFCSGNLELKVWSEKPDASRCKTGCACYAHCLWFNNATFESLAAAAGWKEVRYRKINSALPQSDYMFDAELHT